MKKSNDQNLAKNKLTKTTKDTYNKWNNLATINANDPTWLVLIKIGIRVIGVIILLLLSPLIILGIIVAFFASL